MNIDIISVYVVSMMIGFSGWYSGILCKPNAKPSVAGALKWLLISLIAATAIKEMAGL